ncbi:MAG: Crooked neck-like protein 1, partial [Marteilia pararefringens]
VYSQQNRQNISSDRLKLLEAWLEFEKQLVTSNATAQSAKIVAAVQSKMPERIKKRRQLYNSDGSEAGWEEYYDYLFPDDQLAKPNIKLLSMAKKWKQNKEEV